MDVGSMVIFYADSADIEIVAHKISQALFANIPFSPCTSGRMGAFPAVQLDETILGLTVYIVHVNSRDPHEYTLELECNDHSNSDTHGDSRRRNLVLTNGVLLTEFLVDRLRSVEGINISL